MVKASSWPLDLTCKFFYWTRLLQQHHTTGCSVAPRSVGKLKTIWIHNMTSYGSKSNKYSNQSGVKWHSQLGWFTVYCYNVQDIVYPS